VAFAWFSFSAEQIAALVGLAPQPPLSLQPRQREAKPYQISHMVDEYGLKMGRRR
jgi:hypothetical protein